ncbi:MAG: hypothetical protein K8J09_23320 [Planctomycetes bacterium]|nr:hypothetical protein [Planctomycetota bacterium]MCC7397376.1 hypothetical protein [Planctomycetota bacterium]
MTQVDLPQISLQRYVDLLKRRRWQLLPVSLLGLLVGGLVAFLIPRYYVSDTLLQHESTGEIYRGPDEDPFRQIVDSAQLTIPLYVGEAMRQLKWPEAMVADASLRTLNERTASDRIKVWDGNRGDKGRRYAQIRVSYSDRDGARAAALLNTLVQVWLDLRKKELRDPVEAARREANETATRWSTTYERYLGEKKQIELDYGILPNVDLLLQRERQRDESGLQQKREQLLLATQKQRAELAAAVERKRSELLALPERVPLDPAVLQQQLAADPTASGLVVNIANVRLGLSRWRQGSARRASMEAMLKEFEAQLNEKLAALDLALDADGQIPNPQRELMQKAIAADEVQLAGLDAQLVLLEGSSAAETTRLNRLIEGFALWEQKQADLDNAKKQRDDARDKARLADDKLGQLQKQTPVYVVQEARVPPAPTEPNVLLVAFLGCVLGLGVAIGLVLLIDLLQATFKTVDDVERGVPLPVLGGMSHLETEEERQSARRSRRRTSLIVVALTSLVALIVTIYYVDNTRLPGPVRDLLTMLLGD